MTGYTWPPFQGGGAEHGSICVSASCRAHKQRVYWHPVFDQWVHVAGSWPCEALAGAPKLTPMGSVRT